MPACKYGCAPVHQFSNIVILIDMQRILRLIRAILTGTISLMIVHWPSPFGFEIRCRYYRKKLKYLGTNVKIDTGVYFQNPEFITIDDNCWIDKNVIILAGRDDSTREKIVRKNNGYPGRPGEVFIGKNIHVAVGCLISGISAGIYVDDNCGIAAGSKIFAFTSHYRSEKSPANDAICFNILTAPERQCIVEGPVYLEKNVGVALNAVILPGVTIEKNSFVSINTVVHRNVKMNSICSGNPGQVVSERFRNK